MKYYFTQKTLTYDQCTIQKKRLKLDNTFTIMFIFLVNIAIIPIVLISINEIFIQADVIDQLRIMGIFVLVYGSIVGNLLILWIYIDSRWVARNEISDFGDAIIRRHRLLNKCCASALAFLFPITFLFIIPLHKRLEILKIEWNWPNVDTIPITILISMIIILLGILIVVIPWFYIKKSINLKENDENKPTSKERSDVFSSEEYD